MNTYILGDTHANWSSINTFINRKKPDIIIQTGDFGWWPHMHGKPWGYRGKPFDQYGIKNGNTKIYWCDGNHENHEDLNHLVDQHGWENPIEVMPNVFYMPRGSILNIEGVKFLFFGGADSIDKQHRTQGVSWWPEENIRYQDLNRIDGKEADVVISHVCPEYFGYRPDCIDINKKALNTVYDIIKPKFWFFGHFHDKYPRQDGKFEEYKGCKWRCLNMEWDDGWYHRWEKEKNI
jgi:predicted phosphodiesterase